MNVNSGFAAACAALLFSFPALAIDDDSSDASDKSNRPQFTFSGLSFARVTADFDNIKDAINLGFGLGVRIPSIEWVGLELDTSITVIPGENEGTSPGGGGGGTNCGGLLEPPCPAGTTADRDELQMQIITLYGTLRSPGRFFAVGKVGYRYMQTSIEEIEEADGRSGTAYSAGVGYRYNERGGGVELFYTKVSDSLDMIGLSLSY